MERTWDEFERTEVGPLLELVGAELTRGPPGVLGDRAIQFATTITSHWQLDVWYRWGEAVGSVLTITADSPERFSSALINGVLGVTYLNDQTFLVDGITGRPLVGLRDQEFGYAVKNTWHVFRGTILPMLYDGSWSFWSTEADRRYWQIQILHRIRKFYEHSYFDLTGQPTG